jgi:hypothetical protein
LNAPSAAEELRRLAGEHASALEAAAEGLLALEVAGPELRLTTTPGKLLLVVDEVRLVHGDPAFTALRLAAGFDDATGFAFLARPVGGRDLDALLRRLRLRAARCSQHGH